MLIAAMLLGAALVAVPTAEPAAAAGCSPIHVRGTAVSDTGQVLRGHDVAVYLHQRDRALGGGRTGRNGGFDLAICRTPALAAYAEQHTGHVDLDLVTHARRGGGKLFVRVTSFRYAGSVARAPRGFVAARTDERDGTTYATGAPATESTVASPPLMFVQAVRHMRTDYTIRSSAVTGVKAVVRVAGGGYRAAGTMSVDSSDGFRSARSLQPTRSRPEMARLVRPEIAVSSQYTCYQPNAYLGDYLGAGTCVAGSSARWTGEVYRSKTGFRGCHYGGSRVARFSNRAPRPIATGPGVSYTSTVSVGELGSLTITADYGSGTGVRMRFDRGGPERRFCVGGNGTDLMDSAKLYVTSP